jgi:hypothetical protein
MRSRSLRSLTAAWQVVILGVLHTGLPSHSHEFERPESASDQPVIRADHHHHGTQLVEQAERVQSAPVQLAATPLTRAGVTLPTVKYNSAAYRNTPLRPLERAPPPGAPRAPPQFHLT